MAKRKRSKPEEEPVEVSETTEKDEAAPLPDESNEPIAATEQSIEPETVVVPVPGPTEAESDTSAYLAEEQTLYVTTAGLTIDPEGLSREEITQILQQRALDLAQAPSPEEQGQSIQVVLFSLADESYAVEATFIEEIFPLDGLTPVPCTPDFVVGVVNRRGRILSIIDPHKFMGLGGVSRDTGTQIIAVQAAGLEVGLLTSAVQSVKSLSLDQLQPALPTTARPAAEFTRGVTPDLTVLLDLEALLGDKRIIVWEEVA